MFMIINLNSLNYNSIKIRERKYNLVIIVETVDMWITGFACFVSPVKNACYLNEI